MPQNYGPTLRQQPTNYGPQQSPQQQGPDPFLAMLPPQMRQQAMQNPQMLQQLKQEYQIDPDGLKQKIAQMTQDYSGDISGAKSQMAQAAALRKTATPQGRQAGRLFVAANPLEHIGAGMSKYAGMRDGKLAQEALTEATNKQGASVLQQALDVQASRELEKDEQRGFVLKQAKQKELDDIAAAELLATSKLAAAETLATGKTTTAENLVTANTEAQVQELKDKKDYWNHQVANPKPVKSSSSSYSGSGTGRMLGKERADFEKWGAAAATDLLPLDSYKDEFSETKIGEYDVTGTPFVHIDDLINRVYPEGMDEAELEKDQWRRRYRRFLELPERHKLFGSALTAQEQERWAEASIQPINTPEQARAQIEDLRSILNDAAIKNAENALTKGAGYEYIRNNIGFALPPEYMEFLESRMGVKPITQAELKELELTPQQAQDEGYTVVAK